MKLTFSLLLVVLIAIIGLGWTLDELFSQYQTPEQNDELVVYRQFGLSLAHTLDKQPEPKKFIQDWPTMNDTQIQLMQLNELVLPESLQGDFRRGTPLELESDEHLSIHFILPAHQQVLTISIELSALKQADSSLQLAFTTMFYLGTLIIVSLWLYPLVNRLRQLQTTAKAFGEGQLNQRIKLSPTSYIGDIEREFNHMAQRIETLISDNKLLGNAVSHDLRTPLARLRFGIEALQETENPKTREKYQNHISRDIDEMENLVTVLLSYARLDQTMVAIARHPIALNGLIDECISAVNNTDKIIQWQPKTEIYILGDSNYLKMLINNLLSNARQYANKNILVELSSAKSSVVLTIADDGPGIAKDQREALLQPFTRGDNTTDNQGFGMGLAIVSRIALWHKAELVIGRSITLHGAQFNLTFDRYLGG